MEGYSRVEEGAIGSGLTLASFPGLQATKAGVKHISCTVSDGLVSRASPSVRVRLASETIDGPYRVR